jgi:hypothetical protein
MEPKIPQELEYLFFWNPPRLIPSLLPGKKMSTKTRTPKYFDKHFHEALQLLHVKRLPTLVRDITAIVDAAIKDGVQFPKDILYPAMMVDTLVKTTSKGMADEKAVASFYERTTALLCLPAASVLALRVPFLLDWTQSANVTGYAIAEGFLHFVDPTISGNMYAQLELMGVERKHIGTLANRVSSLVTFELG